MLTITVNVTRVKRAIDGVRVTMRQRKNLLERIAIALETHTKNRISTQGFGEWAPLAKTTRIATGRRKALTPLIPHIKHRSNTGAGTATVYFSGRPTNWSIEQHESGYTSPAVKGQFMKAKGLGGFSSRKASVVPARRIFPTIGEALAIADPITKAWVNKVILDNWR